MEMVLWIQAGQIRTAIFHSRDEEGRLTDTFLDSSVIETLQLKPSRAMLYFLLPAGNWMRDLLC